MDRPHPQVSWVIYRELGRGAFAAACQVCQAQSGPTNAPGVDAFAAQHRAHQSAAPQHYGAGDLVARATGALGIESCTPCEKRRRMLNGLLPRVWKR